MGVYTVDDRLRQCERVVNYHARRLCKCGNWLSVGGADVDDLEQAGRMEVVRLAGLYQDADREHFVRIAKKAVWRRMHDLQREVRSQLGAPRAKAVHPWHTRPEKWLRIEAKGAGLKRAAFHGGRDTGADAADDFSPDTFHPADHDQEVTDTQYREWLAACRHLLVYTTAAERRFLYLLFTEGDRAATAFHGRSVYCTNERRRTLYRRLRQQHTGATK